MKIDELIKRNRNLPYPANMVERAGLPPEDVAFVRDCGLELSTAMFLKDEYTPQEKRYREIIRRTGYIPPLHFEP